MLGEHAVAVRTADIHATGIGLVLSHPVSAGRQGQVAFSMYLSGKCHAVTAKVKVTHCVFSNGEFKTGFLFNRMEPTSMTSISEFLR